MIKIIKELSGGKCIGLCDCGVEKEFYTANIKHGKSKSCGCLQRKPDVPKDVKRTFNLMRYRCNTKTSPDYPRWGALGIKVLYKDVYEFYKDVGDKPTNKHSIDRIDHKGNYAIGNCRWATQKQQANNMSSNNVIVYNGISKTMAQWAEEYDIKYTTLKERLVRGWDIKTALTKEVDTRFNKKAS